VLLAPEPPAPGCLGRVGLGERCRLGDLLGGGVAKCGRVGGLDQDGLNTTEQAMAVRGNKLWPTSEVCVC